MNVARWCRRQRDLLAAQLRVVPSDMERAHALAQAELTLGNLEQGFQLFEARLHDRIAQVNWAPAEPRWIGQPAEVGYDGTLYVQPEQGLGDTIMMARYLPMCRERWAQAVTEVRPPLFRLFRDNFGEMVVPLRAEPISYDFAIPMLSLPLAFRTTGRTIPPAPYLHAQADPTFAGHIGLAWAGAAWHKNDRSRSLPREAFAPLLAALPGPWLSLQLEEQPLIHGPVIPSIQGIVQDVADTAAIVAGLALVITCDSMLAHLAGALGVPCWVLLPYVPDWRWQLDRSDSPWYPSVRLFRQKQPGDWAAVIRRVIWALEHDPIAVGQGVA